MSINSVSSSSFGCEGPDYELIQIMRLLMIYGVVPTGNKATDKARLHDIELLRAKNQNEPSGKFFTISYKQEQEIIEKRRLLKYGSKENYKKEKGNKQTLKEDEILGKQIWAIIEMKKREEKDNKKSKSLCLEKVSNKSVKNKNIAKHTAQINESSALPETKSAHKELKVKNIAEN